MPDAIALTFDATGCKFNFAARTADFGTTVQNALVNIVTASGSDGVFPDRGTSLLADVVAGGSIVGNTAIHLSNVAAVETLYFMRLESPDLADPNEIRTMVLQPAVLDTGRLSLEASFQSVGGEIRPADALFS